MARAVDPGSISTRRGRSRAAPVTQRPTREGRTHVPIAHDVTDRGSEQHDGVVIDEQLVQVDVARAPVALVLREGRDPPPEDRRCAAAAPAPGCRRRPLR